ncbi:MAG: hypothetical protein J7M40_16035 [Planctomycetes bacterium]|nr:hypothetical protein [Planctomycetota bacterium]
MPRNRNLIMLSTALACSVVMAWLCISIRGASSYEIRPRITVPAYRTDTARAIDAYERMLERLIKLTGKNLTDIDTEVKGIARTLHSVDSKLTELTGRMARIEKTLGIEQPKRPLKKNIDTEKQDPDTKRPSESGR